MRRGTTSLPTINDMFKKIGFALTVVVLILGLTLALPKETREASLPTFDLLKTIGVKKTPTTILLTGDIMLGRSVMQTSLSKNKPNYPFEKVAETLKSADLVFANLETPIIDNCPISTSGMIFCTNPKMTDGLKYAGIDIVNLANNHTKNYGSEGFGQTEKYLNQNEISFVGNGNLVIKEVNGTKFGFLGFNFTEVKPKDIDLQLVRESKNKADVLITMVHWGNEYTSDPTKIQKEIANSLIENGSDVIVGNHPHWVQGYDTINGKPIFYSLGNFIFDQAWSENTKEGLAVRLTYQRSKLSKIEEMPIYMNNFVQPEWVK